jgi:hypothetical protein
MALQAKASGRARGHSNDTPPRNKTKIQSTRRNNSTNHHTNRQRQHTQLKRKNQLISQLFRAFFLPALGLSIALQKYLWKCHAEN